MALIASINGDARKIYLDPSAAVGGVLTFHPTVDLYPEYRTLRRTVEAYRPFDRFMEAAGNIAKNAAGTRRTPRFTTLLDGTKLVIPTGVTRLEVTGELLTDDGSDPFDYSLVTGPCFIDYAPAEAEIIIVHSGSAVTEQDKIDIAQATLSAAQAAPIHADIKQVNAIPITGQGLAPPNHWRPA